MPPSRRATHCAAASLAQPDNSDTTGCRPQCLLRQMSTWPQLWPRGSPVSGAAPQGRERTRKAVTGPPRAVIAHTHTKQKSGNAASHRATTTTHPTNSRTTNARTMMARPLSDGRVHRMIVLCFGDGPALGIITFRSPASDHREFRHSVRVHPSVDHVFVGHGLLAALLSKGGLQNIGGWFG